MDENSENFDQKTYRGMIGSLLYLTTTRPDIMFSVGICARFLILNYLILRVLKEYLGILKELQI